MVRSWSNSPSVTRGPISGYLVWDSFLESTGTDFHIVTRLHWMYWEVVSVLVHGCGTRWSGEGQTEDGWTERTGTDTDREQGSTGYDRVTSLKCRALEETRNGTYCRVETTRDESLVRRDRGVRRSRSEFRPNRRSETGSVESIGETGGGVVSYCR